jgi:hypothetical protein
MGNEGSVGIFAKIVGLRWSYPVEISIFVACEINGGLAQLARASAWHVEGHRFDSDILHGKIHLKGWIFFYLVQHARMSPENQGVIGHPTTQIFSLK